MPRLTTGDAAPWFTVRSSTRSDFHFGAAAGRYVVLSFIGSAATPGIAAMVAALAKHKDLFDDKFASLFVVSGDPADEQEKRLKHAPGLYLFWDLDGRIADLYGVIRRKSAKRVELALTTFILDPLLRVVAVVPVKDVKTHAREVIAQVAALPKFAREEPAPPSAPVLLLPRVFEADFCRMLIGLYDKGGDAASGFMRSDPKTGKTVLNSDPMVKRRRDHTIADEGIQKQIQARLVSRLVPEIKKAFQFDATRIERFIVARYSAEDKGFFRAHRDNTTKGTAHRRFAVTINLNAEDYKGGDLMFPEFGRRTYRAPTGGAVVFSCSLMHEALPVTKGNRYCFLPFLYDDAAAKIRAQNLKFVEVTDPP